MKIILPLLLITLFLTGWHKPPTDIEIQRQAVGTWQNTPSVSNAVRIVNEIHSDGSFSTKRLDATNDIEMDGNWKVQDGFIVLTRTNMTGTASLTLGPSVQRYKIVQINKDEILIHLDGDNNLFTMTRK
jgi:hypothetical protein